MATSIQKTTVYDYFDNKKNLNMYAYLSPELEKVTHAVNSISHNWESFDVEKNTGILPAGIISHISQKLLRATDWRGAVQNRIGTITEGRDTGATDWREIKAGVAEAGAMPVARIVQTYTCWWQISSLHDIWWGTRIVTAISTLMLTNRWPMKWRTNGFPAWITPIDLNEDAISCSTNHFVSYVEK